MTRVVLVLGATGGVGSALARLLAHDGVQLALAARGKPRLDALASELGASAHPLDATSFDAVDAAVDELLSIHGALDGVVNCVGSILLKPAHRTSEAEWRATLAANLDTAFAAVRSGSRAMLKTGGSIVLVASAAATVGLPNHEAVAAAKAGVVGLARAAAATQAARRIRVNVVAPGMLRTPLSDPILRAPAALEASIAMHPLGRLGEAGDAARAIAWLLDPAQSFVTGQVLAVDGGLAALRTR